MVVADKGMSRGQGCWEDLGIGCHVGGSVSRGHGQWGSRCWLLMRVRVGGQGRWEDLGVDC